jgi:hypothetical protein
MKRIISIKEDTIILDKVPKRNLVLIYEKGIPLGMVLLSKRS